MMSCIKTNNYFTDVGSLLKKHGGRIERTQCSLSQSSLHVSSVYSSTSYAFKQNNALPRLIYAASKHKRCIPLCMYGGEENLSENKDISLELLKKVIERRKSIHSIDNIWWKQKFDFYGGSSGGGGGRNLPRGGGDGSGGQRDPNFARVFDEMLEVILATIGFIFLYIILVRGKELTMLSRDYIKYLLGGEASVRLRRAMNKWRNFYDIVTFKEAGDDWLDRVKAATISEKKVRGD